MPNKLDDKELRLDERDWVELEWVFSPGGYVQEVLAEQSARLRVFTTDDEPMFIFRPKVGAEILHAACQVDSYWVCGCGVKPCIATALLQLRDAVQPFVQRRG